MRRLGRGGQPGPHHHRAAPAVTGRLCATPYLEASLHSQLAQLAMVMGDHRAAARHAEIAWPVLLRLHALDDARSLRLYTAMEPLLEGDDEACERILDEVDAMGDPGQIGSRMVALAARAELALVRGRVDEGLDAYDVAVASVQAQASRGQAIAVGPWLMLAASGALVAHVRHGRSPRHAVRARELRDLLVGEDAAGASMSYFDLPLNGIFGVVRRKLHRFGPTKWCNLRRTIGSGGRWWSS